MKYLMLVCEGLSDEPLEELSNRTPLEAAKTPAMDLLAKKGKLGSGLFTPHSLKATGDVACLSLLGFDPEEFYTGIAPLEAHAMGILQNDHEVAFRLDLVTVSDEFLVDTSASYISPKESRLLVSELNQKLSSPKIKFYPGDGYKNILVISDPELAESLDELECVPPKSLMGQKFVKNLPKGAGASVLTDLMDASKEILENHEINRVRIDLKENPANMIWPWGQGKKPKMPSFKQRYGLDGAVVSESDFVRGLGRLLGLETAQSLDACFADKDFIFVYKEAGEAVGQKTDLKTKIKLIEDFDSMIVKNAAAMAETGGQPVRIFVGTDYAVSLAKKGPFHGQVPFVIQGSGVEGEDAGAFNEKTAAQSKLIFESGAKLMEYFLKP